MFIVEIIKVVLYFILLFVCAYTDYKYGKIYNKYLLSFIYAFIILHVVGYTIVFIINNNDIVDIVFGLLDSVYGFAVALIIGFVLYLLGVLKGGDAKLIAVVGLCSGLYQLPRHLALIVIVSGIGALYVLLKNKILFKRFKRIYLYFKNIILTRNFERYTTDNDNIAFPLAVFILIAEVISYILYFKGITWI